MSLCVRIGNNLSRSVRMFLDEDRARERGGFLLGVRGSMYGEPTDVRAFVGCPDAPGSAASLTFRPEDWQLAHSHSSVRSGDLDIVGWVHSHPDMPVFLSSADRFIQRHFFPGDGQFAWVIDPVCGDEAIWYWAAGEVLRGGREAA